MSALAFDGPAPRAADLSLQWQALLARAAAIIDGLPADQGGHAVITPNGDLFTGDAAALQRALAEGRGVAFHPGRLGGALPVARP